jgi:hypothetical protein
MARLQAKKIADALKKAQRVGEVEESFTVDGCEVVLRSLRPSEIEAATTASNEFEDLAFINAFKRERICRSVVELNGESLREYDFVEVEVEETDPLTKEMALRTVVLERHQFIADYVFSTWSGEAVDTAYRKYNDLMAKAEKRAVEGVAFTVPEETPEDKYRRLLVEAKELEGEIPFELVGRILNEVGYVAKSSKEELEAAESKLAQVSPEEATPSPETPRGPTPLPDPRALVAARVPLNQRAVSLPVPAPSQEPVPASPRGAVPPQELQARPVIPVSPAALKRAQELQAIEALGPVPLEDSPTVQGVSRLADGIAELKEPMAGIDQKAAERIFEQPPVAGINPRYRPPPRMP